MIQQIKYAASWSRFKLQNRLGQRGAEMVEYAIVLACIAALGAWYYGLRPSVEGGNTDDGAKTLYKVLENMWKNIGTKIKEAIG